MRCNVSVSRNLSHTNDSDLHEDLLTSLGSGTAGWDGQSLC